MAVTQTLTEEEIKQKLEYHIKLLKDYYLNEDFPIPSNSLAIINALKELLEISETNTFYMVKDPLIKALALGYVLILVSHTMDYPDITGFIMFDPKTIEWHYNMGGKDETMIELIRFVKKMLSKL